MDKKKRRKIAGKRINFFKLYFLKTKMTKEDIELAEEHLELAEEIVLSEAKNSDKKLLKKAALLIENAEADLEESE